MNEHQPSPLEALTAHAKADTFFMGVVVAAFQQTHECAEDQLAATLECEVTQISRLCRCRRPLSSEPEFAIQIRRIAAHISCAPEKLLELVRQYELLAALRTSPSKSSSTAKNMFLAARDRLQDPGRSDAKDVPESEGE